jgi:hypothetical protein
MGTRLARFMSRAWLLAVCLILLAGILGAPTASSAVEQASRAEVFEKLGVDNVGAHYVVLVDTSTSMGQEQRYERVKTALESFFGVLSPSDDLTVITFDDRPSIVVFRQKGKQDPGSMIAQLPTKLGHYTDIGHALSVAVEQLQDLPASDIASLIVLTDGRHVPPAGSDFPNVTGAAWDKLSRAARQLSNSHEIQVYAMALTGDTDVGLVSKVFPRTREIALPQGQLTSYFNGIKDRVRAAKARTLLAEDKNGAVQVRWSPDALADVDLGSGSASFDVTLKSTTSHVPLTVSRLRVSSTGELPVFFSVEPRTVTIPPGKSETVTVHATWSPPDEGGPHLKRTTVRTADLKLDGNVESAWTRVIVKDLGLTVPLQLQAGVAPLSAAGDTGFAVWLVVLALVILGLLVAYVYRRLKSPPAPCLAGSYYVGAANEDVEFAGTARSLKEDARGGGVLWFGGECGPEPRVELPGQRGDAFRLEARRSGRRGPVEMWCVAEKPSVRAKLPGDRRPTSFDQGPVPSGTEIQTGANKIKL